MSAITVAIFLLILNMEGKCGLERVKQGKCNVLFVKIVGTTEFVFFLHLREKLDVEMW